MEGIQFRHRPLRKLASLITEAVQKIKNVFSPKTTQFEEILTHEPTFSEVLLMTPRFYEEPEPSLEELGIRRVRKTFVEEYPSIQEVEKQTPKVSWREFKANNRLIDKYFTNKKEVIEETERPRLRLIS